MPDKAPDPRIAELEQLLAARTIERDYYMKMVDLLSDLIKETETSRQRLLQRSRSADG